MIKILKVNDYDLVNEIVNIIFVKQNNHNYAFEYFPNDFYNIRQYVKKYKVLYNDEETINFILVMDNEEILFLYFEDINSLKQCIDHIKGLELLINKNNLLVDKIKEINTNYFDSKTLQLSLNKKQIKNELDSKYLIVPLQKHLLEEYFDIHSKEVCNNCYKMVCIKNNELIGYIDFDDEEIIEICSKMKDSKLTTYLYKQLFLKYLEVTNKNSLIYQTDQELAKEELEAMGFKVVEENINFKF